MSNKNLVSENGVFAPFMGGRFSDEPNEATFKRPVVSFAISSNV